LHTDLSDKLDIYRRVKGAYTWAVLIILLLEAMTFIPNTSLISDTMTFVVRVLLLITGGILLIPLVKYSSLIKCLKDESKIYE
jgi:hypothetical protein